MLDEGISANLVDYLYDNRMEPSPEPEPLPPPPDPEPEPAPEPAPEPDPEIFIPSQINIDGLIGWFDAESFDKPNMIWRNKLGESFQNADTTSGVTRSTSSSENETFTTLKLLIMSKVSVFIHSTLSFSINPNPLFKITGSS